MADSYDTAMDIDEPEAKRARVTPPPEAGPSGAAPLAAEVAHGAAPEVGAGDADVEGAATDDDDEVMMVGGRGESVGARASSAIPSTSLPPPTTSPDRLTDAASAAAPPIANGIPSGESSDDPASVGATGLVPVPSLNARSADGGKHEAFMMADGDGTTVYYPITSVSDSQPGSTAAIVPLPNGTVHAPALPNGHPTSEPPPAPSTSAGATGSTAAGLQAPSVPPVTNGSVAAPSDWRLTHTLRGHQKSLSAVAFSPNGKLLASTGADKLVLLWSFALPRPPASAPHINGSGSSKTAQMPTPAFIRSMKGHTAGLNDVAWAPDSRHFATCADDKTVRLWDASTGECRKTLQGHTHHVFCVAYSPTGGLLISGGWDETIRVWDAKRGTALRTIPAHSESVTSVGFSRDGSVFASGSFDGLIRFWDTSSGRCLKTLNADDDNSPVSSVAFTPNSAYLLATTLNSQVRLWDYKSRDGRVVKSFGGHTNLKYCTPARFITSVKDKQYVASGSEDGKVWLWDLQTRECVEKLEAHHDAVISIAVHPTLPVFVTVALERDPTAKVFVAA